jgi:hypothetical protein
VSLGSNTQVVDGQRNLFPTGYAYTPQGYGPQTTGVPNVSPTMPPYISAPGTSSSSTGLEGVGGYGTAANNTLATAVASQNPFNLKVSPVLWAVGLLLIGLVLLKGIHWRETTLEGFSEQGHVGPASERAEEAVA